MGNALALIFYSIIGWALWQLALALNAASAYDATLGMMV